MRLLRRGTMILATTLLSSFRTGTAFRQSLITLTRGFHRSRSPLRAVNDISVKELKQLFEGEDVPASESVLQLESVQMLDCREVDELVIANYPKPGVEGASKWGAKGGLMMNLPLSTMGGWAPELMDGTLGLDPSKPTVVACKVGGRSMQLCQWLDQNCEFKELYNLRGGINAYSSEVDSSVGGPY